MPGRTRSINWARVLSCIVPPPAGSGGRTGATAVARSRTPWPGPVVLAVAAVALWDAWRRIGGRPSFPGAGGNVGRLLAFGPPVLVLVGLAALLFRLF
jgi:hypothetical protein